MEILYQPGADINTPRTLPRGPGKARIHPGLSAGTHCDADVPGAKDQPQRALYLAEGPRFRPYPPVYEASHDDPRSVLYYGA